MQSLIGAIRLPQSPIRKSAIRNPQSAILSRDGGIRTCGHLLRRQALFVPLSYILKPLVESTGIEPASLGCKPSALPIELQPHVQIRNSKFELKLKFASWLRGRVELPISWFKATRVADYTTP